MQFHNYKCSKLNTMSKKNLKNTNASTVCLSLTMQTNSVFTISLRNSSSSQSDLVLNITTIR